MKSATFSLLAGLLMSPTVQAFNVYQVQVGESLSGVCYSEPVNLQGFDDKEACKEQAESLNQLEQEKAQIPHPDTPATGEYVRHETDGQVVQKMHFCFNDDEDFNRRLGRRLCEAAEAGQTIPQNPSDI